MKKIVIILIIISAVELAQAQLVSAKVDHYAIVVDDLDASATFYSEILRLNEITNQTKKSHIRWFAFGDGVELHLIKMDRGDIVTNKNLHLAVAVNDLDYFIKHLKANGIPYENWPGEANATNGRPDGVTQVYIQDPDGYWIEVNDANRF